MKQKEFLELCARGSREQIEQAIEAGVDVNKKAYMHGVKVPPIFVAVMEENFDAVRVLIEHGAHTGDGFAAAVIKGKKKLLKQLIDCGGDINQNDSNNNNTLLMAITSNNVKMVKWLIELGADVNKKIDSRYSPLTYTVLAQMQMDGLDDDFEYISPEIITRLMKAGADYDEAMIIAIRTGNIPFLELILQNGADINRKCIFNGVHTPLSAAMFTGENGIDTDMLRFLAENGADLNEIFELGENEQGEKTYTNAVNISIAEDRPDITRILLENGANPNYQDRGGRTALVYAVVTSEEIVRALLENGANPNIPDENKRTPLMLAVLDSGAEPGIIEALIEYGADINARDKEGMTALLWAVGGKDRSPGLTLSSLIRTGGLRAEGWQSWFALTVLYSALKREAQLDSIRLLVNHGADPKISDDRGMNAIACAMMSMDDEVIEILTGNKEE